MFHETFQEYSISRTAVFEWHSRFKAGRVSAEDEKCSGRPSTSKMIKTAEKIQKLIHKDHHGTIHQLPDTTGISYGVCQEILTKNLNMHHVAPSSR
jgi:hypothetical protein